MKSFITIGVDLNAISPQRFVLYIHRYICLALGLTVHHTYPNPDIQTEICTTKYISEGCKT